MTTEALKEPHLLLASSNPRKLLRNVRHLIGERASRAIEREIKNNVAALYALGLEHYRFATKAPRRQWRQRISRLYYGAYNVKRAVQLYVEGVYRTDSSDHKNIGKLPDDFPNSTMYGNQLSGLRDDRNLADYNHTAGPDDLLMPPNDAELLVEKFIEDTRQYLNARGFNL